MTNTNDAAAEAAAELRSVVERLSQLEAKLSTPPIIPKGTPVYLAPKDVEPYPHDENRKRSRLDGGTERAACDRGKLNELLERIAPVNMSPKLIDTYTEWLGFALERTPEPHPTCDARHPERSSKRSSVACTRRPKHDGEHLAGPLDVSWPQNFHEAPCRTALYGLAGRLGVAMNQEPLDVVACIVAKFSSMKARAATSDFTQENDRKALSHALGGAALTVNHPTWSELLEAVRTLARTLDTKSNGDAIHAANMLADTTNVVALEKIRTLTHADENETTELAVQRYVDAIERVARALQFKHRTPKHRTPAIVANALDERLRVSDAMIASLREIGEKLADFFAKFEPMPEGT